MAGFNRMKGGDNGFESVAISSITVVKGDLLMWDYANHVAILATSACTPERVAGVAVESLVGPGNVLIQKPAEFDEYVVDATNAVSEDDNYQRMALTDENAVNNTADQTDDTGIVMQLGTVGTTQIRVRFVTRMDRAA